MVIATNSANIFVTDMDYSSDNGATGRCGMKVLAQIFCRTQGVLSPSDGHAAEACGLFKSDRHLGYKAETEIGSLYLILAVFLKYQLFIFDYGALSERVLIYKLGRSSFHLGRGTMSAE
jgi:hypothetical protein